ncbi:hypothetical protein [Tetragenococcus koreensis]|nr:hypothetical protein [Tetragenococcus koreensis]
MIHERLLTSSFGFLTFAIGNRRSNPLIIRHFTIAGDFYPSLFKQICNR